MTRTHKELELRRTRDGMIARDCLAHRDGAWEALIERFERPLGYYVAQQVGAERCADVMQEVWLSAYASLAKLERPEGLRSWLYRLAHRRCADLMRAQGRAQTIAQAVADEPTPDTPPQPLDVNADARSLHQAIAALPVHHRAVVVLFYFEDLGVAQIAQTLEVPPGTVKSRIHHARQALRKTLMGSPDTSHTAGGHR